MDSYLKLQTFQSQYFSEKCIENGFRPRMKINCINTRFSYPALG